MLLLMGHLTFINKGKCIKKTCKVNDF